MDLDLRQLTRIASRRWWIVALLMIIAGTSAYVSSARETPLYTASATLMLSPGLSSSINDYNAIITTQRMTESYQHMAMSQPMRDRVREVLGDKVPGTGYTASVAPDSAIIRISVTGTDPEAVALVANTVVSEFQGFVSDYIAERAQSTRSGMDAQIEALQLRQDVLDQQLLELRAREDAGNTEIQYQIDDLTAERANITRSIVTLQTNAVTLDAQMAASSVRIQPLNAAVPPGRPFSPQPQRSLMLGLFVGALLGAGVVAALEFLDNTVKPEVDVQGLAGASVLATVSELPRLEAGGHQVFTLSQPKSGAAEAMRLLRTNLEFASASRAIHSLTVTSPSPGEGKSTVSANLGTVMAQAGLLVVVIDADMRKPSQDRIFGIGNRHGLTTLLMHPELSWESVARKVALPGLLLIPSGPIPPNPSDLLRSDRFIRLIEVIKSDVDMVIIDSPPVLSASDSLIVARHTDGVVMVCHSSKTRTDALRHASHAIHQGDIRLIGVVLNRQKGQPAASYYGEFYGPTRAPATVAVPGD